MDRPDWFYTPACHVPWTFDAGLACYRVFNHVDAAAHGYLPTAFNPTIPPKNDDEGGRFDATATDPFAYLYGAPTLEATVHERVLSRAEALPGAGLVLSGAEVAERSWCTFFCDETLELVNLMDANGLNRFKATVDLVRSTEYSITREWGHYIRKHAPNVHGFVWPSRPHGGLPAFVLFEDRLETANIIENASFEFDTPVGRKILSSICAKAGVALNWP